MSEAARILHVNCSYLHQLTHEFSNIGVVPEFEKMIAVIRSRATRR